MQRRRFLAGLALLPALPLAAYAGKSEFSIGIYPGTGKADILTADFRALAKPFAEALGASLGLSAHPMLFRSIKSVTRSMGDRRLDAYFVPPSVAVAALDNGYTPVARVRDQASGALVRRKDAARVAAVALTEKESWLDVMARYTLKRKAPETTRILNFKTQEEVVLSMRRGFAEAGSLREKAVDELVASGHFEVWHALPTTPDFTLVASDRLSAADRDKIGAAAVALDAAAIRSLQKIIHSKVSGFVVDKQADYRVIKQAISEAGY